MKLIRFKTEIKDGKSYRKGTDQELLGVDTYEVPEDSLTKEEEDTWKNSTKVFITTNNEGNSVFSAETPAREVAFEAESPQSPEILDEPEVKEEPVVLENLSEVTKADNVVFTPTFGQKAVGISFNPSGDGKVDRVKQHYANIIDMMNELRNDSNSSPETKRLASVAITEAQGAQMWAVKAITWKD